MAGYLHNAIVTRAVGQNPGAKTRGFLRAIRAEILDADDDLTVALMREFKVIPDAFFLDHENSVVVAIEVEVAHPLSQEKMERYFELSWLLDDYHWQIAVLAIDRWGRERLIDIHIKALEQMIEEARQCTG